MHSESHELAGKTVTVTLDGAEVKYRIEDWWDKLTGSSWMFADGNPAAFRSNHCTRCGLNPSKECRCQEKWDSATVTEVMVDRALSSVTGHLRRDSVQSMLTAARSVDPLVAEAEGLRRENELLRRVANAAERGITRGECGPCDYGLMMGCSCNEMDKALAALSTSPGTTETYTEGEGLRRENERLREAAEAVVYEWRMNDDLWPDHRVRRLSEPMRLLSMRLRSAELEHQTPAALSTSPGTTETYTEGES